MRFFRFARSLDLGLEISRRVSLRSALLLGTLVFTLPLSAEAACRGEAWDALRAFDGSWSLRDGDAEAGSSTGSLLAGGCLLHEEVRVGASTMIANTHVDPSSGVWRQTVVDETGTVTTLSGRPTVRGGRLDAITLDGVSTTAGGNQQPLRITMKRQDNGELVETISTGDGTNWTQLHQWTYQRPGQDGGRPTPRTETREAAAAKPSNQRDEKKKPMPEPAPADSTTTKPSVVLVSSERTGDPGNVAKISVTSPMLMEVPLGPVENLPENYAWSSTDVARYEVQGTTIERIEVRKRTKRGDTTLLVTFYASSSAFADEYRISASLLGEDGLVLSEAPAQKMFVGRSIGEQTSTGTVSKTLELKIDADVLDRALAGSVRPRLALRVEAKEVR